MSEQTEIRVWAGGQVDSDSHGDVTFGVRRGSFRAELFTDTVELAFEPQRQHGKAWVAARACGFAAEMFISPWSEGAPLPLYAHPVAYVGVEAGAQRWGPHGLWGGARGWAREYIVDPYGPGATTEPVFRGDLEGGMWTPALQASLRVGAHVEPGSRAAGLFQPHVEGDAHWRPDWRVGPVVEGWGAYASGQGAFTRTRVGGLTPYVVPMAGAAWAEWWVQDYAVGRVGAAAGSVGMATPAPRVRARGQLAADVAAFSDPTVYVSTLGVEPTLHAVGFSASGKLTYKHFYTDLAVGYAPWIPRQEGYSRASAFFRVGVDWAPLKRSKD